MLIDDAKRGNIYIISEMILWSLFPIVALLGLNGVASLVSLYWVNLFATIFFFLIVVFRGKVYELKKIKVWFYAIGTVLFINVIFYGLFFYALNKTTPANASIVALFEIVPSYIFFQIIKKRTNLQKTHIGDFLSIDWNINSSFAKGKWSKCWRLYYIDSCIFPSDW